MLMTKSKGQILAVDVSIVSITDYGRPMKPFFIEIQNFWPWAENWADKYQHPFWYSESLVHVFHYSTIISTKN